MPVSPLQTYSAQTDTPPALITRVALPPVQDLAFVWLPEAAWIANAWRRVGRSFAPDGYTVIVDGIATFWIDRSGDNVICFDVDQSAPPEIVVETAIGAPLLVALALRSTWSLHASAVTRGSRVILFLGDSGIGKSTLAHHLGADPSGPFRLIADDILPTTISNGTAYALAHYPQLKFPPHRQPGIGFPERTPLAAAYVLQPPSSPHSAVAIQPLTPHEATLALVRHTVAAQLFDGRLLEQHLIYCTALARSVPVYQLTYPRGFDLLPAVVAAIRAN